MKRVAVSTTQTKTFAQKQGYEVNALQTTTHNWRYCHTPVALWDELSQKILYYKAMSILWIQIKLFLC